MENKLTPTTTETAPNLSNAIIYGFGPSSVRGLNHNEFLTHWGPQAFPDLQQYFDRFIFYVNGFDDDPREVFEIPEVRAFYRAFRNAWPYWLFACQLNMPFFQPLVLCCLDTLEISRSEGQKIYRVDFKPTEMRLFLSEELTKMDVICRQAGMSKDQIEQRVAMVMNYFGFSRAAQTNL